MKFQFHLKCRKHFKFSAHRVEGYNLPTEVTSPQTRQNIPKKTFSLLLPRQRPGAALGGMGFAIPRDIAVVARYLSTGGGCSLAALFPRREVKSLAARNDLQERICKVRRVRRSADPSTVEHEIKEGLGWHL